MNIKFKLRNEEGLHCRFCKDKYMNGFCDLYETSPIKGIICDNCCSHLKDYLSTSPNTDFTETNKSPKSCPKCGGKGYVKQDTYIGTFCEYCFDCNGTGKTL